LNGTSEAGSVKELKAAVDVVVVVAPCSAALWKRWGMRRTRDRNSVVLIGLVIVFDCDR
jgi:hypothetical protein